MNPLFCDVCEVEFQSKYRFERHYKAALCLKLYNFSEPEGLDGMIIEKSEEQMHNQEV